jgi:ArsR family transcriptional regulator, arsenate/arsenite/antimonite-responsive transcriptional repressor
MPIMTQPEALQVKPRKRRVGKVGGDSAGCQLTVHPSMRAEEATDLANFLRALADPTRLQMVSLLAEHPGEVCVCDITRSFDLDQSTISHHLRLLREAGVIECVRHGVWAYYFFRAGALEPIKQLLKRLERLEMPG